MHEGRHDLARATGGQHELARVGDDERAIAWGAWRRHTLAELREKRGAYGVGWGVSAASIGSLMALHVGYGHTLSLVYAIMIMFMIGAFLWMMVSERVAKAQCAQGDFGEEMRDVHRFASPSLCRTVAKIGCLHETSPRVFMWAWARQMWGPKMITWAVVSLSATVVMALALNMSVIVAVGVILAEFALLTLAIAGWSWRTLMQARRIERVSRALSTEHGEAALTIARYEVSPMIVGSVVTMVISLGLLLSSIIYSGFNPANTYSFGLVGVCMSLLAIPLRPAHEIESKRAKERVRRLGAPSAQGALSAASGHAHQGAISTR